MYHTHHATLLSRPAHSYGPASATCLLIGACSDQSSNPPIGWIRAVHEGPMGSAELTRAVPLARGSFIYIRQLT